MAERNYLQEFMILVANKTSDKELQQEINNLRFQMEFDYGLWHPKWSEVDKMKSLATVEVDEEKLKIAREQVKRGEDIGSLEMVMALEKEEEAEETKRRVIEYIDKLGEEDDTTDDSKRRKK